MGHFQPIGNGQVRFTPSRFSGGGAQRIIDLPRKKDGTVWPFFTPTEVRLLIDIMGSGRKHPKHPKGSIIQASMTPGGEFHLGYFSDRGDGTTLKMNCRPGVEFEEI